MPRKQRQDHLSRFACIFNVGEEKEALEAERNEQRKKARLHTTKRDRERKKCSLSTRAASPQAQKRPWCVKKQVCAITKFCARMKKERAQTKMHRAQTKMRRAQTQKHRAQIEKHRAQTKMRRIQTAMRRAQTKMQGIPITMRRAQIEMQGGTRAARGDTVVVVGDGPPSHHAVLGCFETSMSPSVMPSVAVLRVRLAKAGPMA